jgi:hypothetical protein
MEVTGRELNAAMLTEYPPGKQKRPDLSTGAFFYSVSLTAVQHQKTLIG